MFLFLDSPVLVPGATGTINRSKPWEGAPYTPPTNIRGPEGKEPGGGGIPQPIQAQASKQLRTQNVRRNQAQTETIQHQKEDSKHSDHPAQLNIASTSTILPNAEASPRNRCLKATSGASEADQVMADPTSPPGLNQVRPNTRVETSPAIAHPLAKQPNFGKKARTKKRYIKLDLLALAPQDLASSLQNEYDGLGSIGSPAAQGQQGNA